MCGIVGMAGKLTSQHKDIMSAMLTVCSLRGMHSTGVFMVKGKDHDITVAKTVGPPIELFNTLKYDRMIAYDSTVLAGHCRAATSGPISRQTAHPFENDGLVGMHNGTLQNWRSTLDDSSYFDVDSECLLHNIALHGVEKVIPKIKGAYALVWYDKTTNTINFLKNSQRPLWTAMTKDKDVLFWASEYWMLDMLRSEHGKRQEFQMDKEENQFFPLPDDTLTRFRIDTSKEATKVFTKLQSKVIEGDSSKPTYTAPFQGRTTTTSNSNTGYWGYDDQHWSKVWQDEEWKEWDRTHNNPTPLLITDLTKVKKEEPSLMESFKNKLLNRHTPSTSNKVTQIGPIPKQDLKETTVGDKTNILTASTSATDTSLPNLRRTVRGSSKSSPHRLTNTLTLVSNNKDAGSVKSKKPGDLSVPLCQPSHPDHNFNGAKWSFKQFTQHTGGSCCNCDNPLTEEDFDNNNTTIAWLTRDAFMCSDCNTVPLLKNIQQKV
jgi:predicted glutamine amidotransferase